MKQIEQAQIKKAPKQEREKKILLGLVDLYLKSGKPIGSHTLQEAGFEDLSSATIRNYFVSLEEEGYLTQPHTSGGRVPTDKALRLYADFVLSCEKTQEVGHAAFPQFQEPFEIKEVILYLEQMAEATSSLCKTAVFISSPRFDHDFIVDMKLVGFDSGRYLACLLTQFGFIHTEVLHTPKKLSLHSLKRIEAYFQAHLKGMTLMPGEIDPEELEVAHRFYQEAMARYLVSYANFTKEDIFRAGFSRLLYYPEFQDAQSLASALSLFENQRALHALTRECIKTEKIKYWIGSDLFSYLTSEMNSSVVAAPYAIANKMVGAIGVIGPTRLNYREIFASLRDAATAISKVLTSSLYKYKITFRTPGGVALDVDKKLLLDKKEEV